MQQHVVSCAGFGKQLNLLTVHSAGHGVVAVVFLARGQKDCHTAASAELPEPCRSQGVVRSPSYSSLASVKGGESGNTPETALAAALSAAGGARGVGHASDAPVPLAAVPSAASQQEAALGVQALLMQGRRSEALRC